MLEAIAVVAIVGYVIGRQLLGEPLRGKRLLLLPAVLVVIGLSGIAGGHLDVTAVALIVASAAIAAAIGVRQGLAMRLESRDGALWGQMPVRSLWLWLALVLSRVLFMLLGVALHAHLATDTTTILFGLGVNRLAQAAVIARRALAAGIPFAPEKDGSSFLGSLYDDRAASAPCAHRSAHATSATSATSAKSVTPSSL